MSSGKRGTEGGKAAGTSSSNFQPNQLDNDKTSRTSSVVHRSRLSPVSHPFYILLRSIDPPRSGPILFLPPLPPPSSSLVIAGIIEREKREEKEMRQSAVRDPSDILYASLQRDIRSLRNDQKLSLILRKHTFVYIYSFSSPSHRRRRHRHHCRRRRRRHHRRRRRPQRRPRLPVVTALIRLILASVIY
jgi:hypothetical protein